MAEGKKKLYKRETVKKHLKELIERVKLFQSGEADLPYPDKIEELIIFGSYVNSDREKIHDLDIFLELNEDRSSWQSFAEIYLKGNSSYSRDFLTWLSRLPYYYLLARHFLKK